MYISGQGKPLKNGIIEMLFRISPTFILHVIESIDKGKNHIQNKIDADQGDQCIASLPQRQTLFVFSFLVSHSTIILLQKYCRTFFLVQRSSVGFVPDKYDKKTCNSTTQVCEVSDIITRCIKCSCKKIDQYITCHCPFCFDRYRYKHDIKLGIREKIGKPYHDSHNGA